jgi:Right handed beta helix region
MRLFIISICLLSSFFSSAQPFSTLPQGQPADNDEILVGKANKGYKIKVKDFKDTLITPFAHLVEGLSETNNLPIFRGKIIREVNGRTSYVNTQGRRITLDSISNSVDTLSSYVELRAYKGAAKTVVVTDLKKGGTFNLRVNANYPVDDGVVIGSFFPNRVWVRQDVRQLKMSMFDVQNHVSLEAAIKYGEQVIIDENTTNFKSGGMAVNKNVVIKGVAGKTLTVNSVATYGANFYITAENVTIEDIEFRQSDTTQHTLEFVIRGGKSNLVCRNIKAILYKGLFNVESSTATISNIEVSNCTVQYKGNETKGDNSLINIGANVSNAIVKGNTLNGNGKIGNGIDIRGNNYYAGTTNFITETTVEGNTVKNMGEYGIVAYSNYPNPVDVNGFNRIFNLTINNNTVDSVFGGRPNIHKGSGIYVLAVTNFVVSNNRVFNANLNTTGGSLVPAAIGGSENHHGFLLSNRVGKTAGKGISFTVSDNLQIINSETDKVEGQALAILDCKKIKVTGGVYRRNALKGTRTIYCANSDSLVIESMTVNSGQRGVGFNNVNNLHLVGNTIDVKEFDATYSTANEGVEFVNCDTVYVAFNTINQTTNHAAFVLLDYTSGAKGFYTFGQNTYRVTTSQPFLTRGIFKKIHFSNKLRTHMKYHK